MLDDGRVDVVDITGPSHVHAQQGIAAAQAGKHLLVEKPMALDDGRRTGRCATRWPRPASRAWPASCSAGTRRWRRSSRWSPAGRIGELFYAEVDYWHGMRPTHHAWDLHSRKKTGGSAMLLGGCHAVDALRWLAGDEVVEVVGHVEQPARVCSSTTPTWWP